MGRVMISHDYDAKAMAKCNDLGLHPLKEPMGDSHHTDATFNDEDKSTGDALAYFLGDLFADVEERYWHYEVAPTDQWQRVARALRIHNLTITDRTS